MDDKTYGFNLEFNYDDVSEGMMDIIRTGKDVMSVFLKMADEIAKSTTKIGSSAKVSMDPLTALEKAAEKVFKNVAKGAADIGRQLRQADMSTLHKQADTYGERIQMARNEVTKLNAALQAATVTDEQRLKITQRIAETQTQIVQMSKAQGQLLNLAQLAQSAKEANGILKDVDKLLGGIGKEIQGIHRAASESGMSELEKTASRYTARIQEAKAELAQMEMVLQRATVTDEQRLQIQNRILDTRRQIDVLEREQGRHLAAAKAAEEQAKAAEDQAQALKESQAQAQAFQASMKGVDQALAGINKEIDGVATTLRQTNMSPWEKQADNYARKLHIAQETVNHLNAELQQAQHTDEQRLALQEKMQQAQRELLTLATKQVQHVEQLRQAEVAQADAKAKAQAAALRSQIGSEAKQGLQDVTTAAAVASAALTLGLGSAAKSWAELQQHLTSFQAISGASTAEVQKFKETAYSLTVLGKTSTEIAGLGSELSKAGLSALEVNRALGTLTEASVAVNEDLNATGMAIDAVRTQFGLGIEDIERVSNGMVLTANKSKVSIADLNESFKYLGSTAAQSGQPLEDVNTLLVLLGNSGIKASQAGNGLQNAFLRMADPQVRKALKEIGVEVVDAQGNFLKMTDIVIDLQAAMSGVSQANKESFLKQQFGEVALNPLLALMGKTKAEIESTRITMEHWQGTQARVAKDMEQGFAYSLKQVIVALDTFKKQFGESLEPVLVPLLHVVRDVLQAFNSLPMPLKTLVSTGMAATAAILTFSAALGATTLATAPLLLGLGKIANQLVLYTRGAPAVAAANLTIGQSFTAMQVAISNLPALLGKLAVSAVTSLGSVATSAAAASAPFLPFIALAGALYAAWELNLGGFRDIMSVAFEAARMTLEDFGGWFDGFLQQTQLIWMTAWEGIKGTLFTVLGVIDQGLRGLFTVFDTTFQVLADVMTGNWRGAWETVTGIMQSATDGMTKALGGWLQKFGQVFQIGMNGLGTMAAGLWDMLSNPTDMSGGIARVKAGFESLQKAATEAGKISAEAWNSTFDAINDAAKQSAEIGRKRFAESGIEDKLLAAQKALKQPKQKEPVDAAKDSKIAGMLDGNNSRAQGEGFAERVIRESRDAMERGISKGMKDFFDNQHQAPAAGGSTTLTLSQQYAPGALTSPYGMRTHPIFKTQRLHTGNDYGAAMGAPVKSQSDGVVAFAGWFGGYGNAVIVDAGGGKYVLYGHNSAMHKKVGDVVRKGERIASVGSTGNSTGPHSHQEIREGKAGLRGDAATSGTTPVDPNDHHEVHEAAKGVTEEYKRQVVSLAELEKHMARIVRAQSQLGGRTKENASDWDALEKEKSRIMSENSQHREKLAKAEADTRANALKDQAAAEKELGALRTEILEHDFQNRVKNLSNQVRLEKEHKAELIALDKKHQQQVEDFKGNDAQLAQLKQLHQRRRDQLQEDQRREAVESFEAQQAEMDKIRRQYLADAVAREKQAVSERVDAEIKALTEQQKNWNLASKEYWELEEFKTEAVRRGNEERLQIESDAQKGIISARRAAIQSALSEDESSFMGSLDSLIAGRRKRGMAVDQIGNSLNGQELLGLADTLGQGSISKIAENLRAQLKVVRDEEILVNVDHDRAKTAGNESKLAEAIAATNRLQAERLRLESALALVTDKTVQGQIEGYRVLIPEIEKAKETHAQFQAAIEGIGQAAQGLFSIFGEAGRNIAAGIGVAVNALDQAMKIKTAFESMPKGSSIADFFGKPENLLSVFGLITTGIGLVGQLITGIYTSQVEMQKLIRDTVNARLDYEEEGVITALRKQIEERRRAGGQTSELEEGLARTTMENEIKRIGRTTPATAVSAENQAKLRGMSDSERRMWLLENGSFDPAEALRQYEAGALPGTPQILEALRQYKAAIATNDAELARIADARRQRALELEKMFYDQMAEEQILAAERTQERLKQIDLEAEKGKSDLSQQMIGDLSKAGLLVDPGQKLTENQLRQKAAIEAYYREKGLKLDRDTEQKRRDHYAEQARLQIDALMRTEDAKVAAMEDGALKEMASLKAAQRRESLQFDVQLTQLDKNSKEWADIAAQKAAAWEAAEERIRQASKKTAEQRERDLANYRNQTGVALAALTADTADDVLAQGRMTALDLIDQEAKAREKAINDHGQDQEMLTAISKYYAALRAKNDRETEQGSLDAKRKAWEDYQQRMLTAQLEPLQRILDKEAERVKVLRRANEELEHSLKLIDERYAKEDKALRSGDRKAWLSAMAAIDIQPELQAGIEHIANEDIKNGKVTDRSSKGTQVRGLLELIAMRQQDAETRFKNEGYSDTSEEDNERLFKEEMARLAVLEGRALGEARLEAKNAKEKSDLDAKQADAYIRYQNLQREALEAKRKAERSAKEEMIASNNRQIDANHELVQDTQRTMEDIQQAHDQKLKGVADAFLLAGNASSVLIENLQKIAPTLAQQAQQAIGSIKSLATALTTPMGGAPGAGSTSTTNSDIIPFRTTAGPGYTVPGPDGRFYATNSQMIEAARLQRIPGYKDGRTPPGHPTDTIAAFLKSDEWVVPDASISEIARNFSLRMAAAPRHFGGIPAPATVNNVQSIGDIYISRDVDLNKLDKLLGDHGFRQRGKGMSRYGGSGLSRTT